MDSCPVFQGLATSLAQYKRESNKDNQKEFEHQLDLTLTHSSNGRQLSAKSKSIILLNDVILCGLTNLIDKRFQPSTLIHKTLMILSYLILDRDILKHLCTRSLLVVKLARFLESSTGTVYQSSLLQTLKLLQMITYKLTVTCPNGCIEDILDFSVHTVVSECSAEYRIASLAIISNLSYTNVSVQAYLKGLSSASALNRVLIANMKDESLAVLILSLSILSSLWLEEDLGMKIFNGKNIEQTFQLIFKLTCQSPDKMEDSRIVIRSCVDLFCSITQTIRIQTALVEYELLPKYLQSICKLFSIADANRASLLLELLLSICKMERPTELLVRIVLYETDSSSVFLDIIAWIGQPLQSNQTATFLAIDLLRVLFEIDPGPSSVISHLSPALSKQLSIGVNCLRAEQNQETQGSLYLTKLIKLLHLTSTVCKHSLQLQPISESISDQLLLELYTFILSTTQSLFSIHNERENELINRKSSAIQLLLVTVKILATLKDSKRMCQEAYNSILEDPRLLPYLSYAITHSDRRETLLSLELLRDALQRPNFHISNFGNILATSSHNQKELIQQSTPQVNDVTDTARKRHNPLKLDSNSVEDSIERMRSGLSIADMRNTDIIDIYEYKLSTLETKVNQIEALQETKSLSLQQSERLGAQLRCKLADSESECQNLSNALTQIQNKLLKEERKVKCLTERENELSFDNDSLKREIISLQELEVKCIQIAAEVADKSEVCDRLKANLKRECSVARNLQEDNESLEVTIQTLKSQQERLFEQNKDTEIEKQKYKQILLERDNYVKELEVNVTQQSTKISQIERQLEEIIAERDSLAKQIANAQKSKESLMERANELQSEKIKLNSELQIEREGQKLTKAKLEKMQQLAAMIHDLSGTSGIPNTSNFLSKATTN
ncbi:Protein CIP2A isoform X1 [Oopsacas minuta]|uniref:Protein CIP2A isoform X1 n=1 Tax=Oopsacas minuta TaxID=111878 RepID=A0AAV7JUP9_9METZ|nr:Protein CIP2A isoform X1 [Oopsacas minuta]